MRHCRAGPGQAVLARSSPRRGSDGRRGAAARARRRADRRPTRASRAGASTSEALAALAASLGERGVLQPVLVRPRPGGRYELIAGERRWRAAQLAGLESIPALVRARDDAESLELALIENMAREDLNPVEEARACAALVEELGLSREEVGRRVGRSRVAVSQPDPPARPARRGARAARAGRAQRGARPRAAARRGSRRPPAPGRARRSHEGWSVRTLEARAREGNADQRKSSARPGRVTRHPDQERRRAIGRGARLGARRRGPRAADARGRLPRRAVVRQRRGGPRVGTPAAAARGGVSVAHGGGHRGSPAGPPGLRSAAAGD